MRSTLSDSDIKTLIDEATAALNAGDCDKAIEIARVLARDRHSYREPNFGSVIVLLARLHPILVKRGITE